MSYDPKHRRGCKVSEMWVGTRTTCGDTSMVVGITVAGKTHVFLATREVFGKFADQIAAVSEPPVLDRRGPQPRALSRNGADRDIRRPHGGRGGQPI